MKPALLFFLAALASGCVVVYAPRADRVAGQMHDQEAEYMAIEQRIDPRVSDEMTGVAGIKIRGDVGSGNRAKAEATRVER